MAINNIIQIPYFTQKILENYGQLSINLVSISLGDATFGNGAALTDVPITAYMMRHNHVLDVPEDIMSVFEEASAQCGFQEVVNHLSYPSQGPIIIPGNPEGENFDNYKRQPFDLQPRQVSGSSRDVPPVTIAQVNESIHGPCFGPCATLTTAINYLSAAIKW